MCEREISGKAERIMWEMVFFLPSMLLTASYNGFFLVGCYCCFQARFECISLFCTEIMAAQSTVCFPDTLFMLYPLWEFPGLGLVWVIVLDFWS